MKRQVSIVLLLLVVGCAEKASDDGVPTTRGVPGKAAVSGTVTLQGQAPEPKKIRMGTDPNCSRHASGEDIYSDEVLVNEAGQLQNVFVYIKTGLEGTSWPVPQEAVVLDQKGCMYDPHVFGLVVNQELLVRNSDPTLHNVHSTGKEDGNAWNFGLPREGLERPRTFEAPEVMVRIKCDVHPWMSSYCGVLSHPYFAVTDANGQFRIPNLPAGSYTLAAWHERYGEQTLALEVADGATLSQDFSYEAAP